MSKTTPTGVPIEYCQRCEFEHPVTRVHCRSCGSSSLFIEAVTELCLDCREIK